MILILLVPICLLASVVVEIRILQFISKKYNFDQQGYSPSLNTTLLSYLVVVFVMVGLSKMFILINRSGFDFGGIVHGRLHSTFSLGLLAVTAFFSQHVFAKIFFKESYQRVAVPIAIMGIVRIILWALCFILAVAFGSLFPPSC